MLEWRKTCKEFSKRIDIDLPFYYYTSTNERYHEGERPDFNKFVKPTRNSRHQRVRTREQPGNLAVGGATIIQAGSKSIRRQFHNLPVTYPPPLLMQVTRSTLKSGTLLCVLLVTVYHCFLMHFTSENSYA